MSVTILLRGGPGDASSYELDDAPATLDWVTGSGTVTYGPATSTGGVYIFVPVRTIDRILPPPARTTPAPVAKKKRTTTTKKTPPPPPTFGTARPTERTL